MSSNTKLFKEIQKRVPAGSLISFDVFDTLIYRPIEPHLPIEATSRYIIDYLGLENSPEIFSQMLALRNTAWESVFAAKRENSSNYEDALLGEMFERFVDLTGNKYPNIKLNPNAAKDFLSFETELERHLLSPIQDSLESLILLKKSGYKLGFISDMYLDSRTVSSYLDQCGYSNLFDFGYVSGEVGLLKRTGSLFEFIKSKEVNIDLHVGDNLGADFTAPRKNAIKAFHWESPEMLRSRLFAKKLTHELNNSPEIAPYLIMSLANKNKGNNSAGLLPQAYSVFALLLLMKMGKSNSQIVFPAREGLLFHAAFLLSPSYIHKPKSNYVPLSRNAVMPSAFFGAPLNAFQVWLENNPQLNFIQLMRKIDFSDLEIRQIASEVEIPSITAQINFHQFLPAFVRLMSNTEFQKQWKLVTSNKQRQIVSLFEQFGNPKSDHIFVDLGWNATIQSNVIEALPKASSMFGLYLGLNENAKRSDYGRSSVEALVAMQGKDYFSHAAFTCPQLLEILTLAPHKSATTIPNNFKNDRWADISKSKLNSKLIQSVQSHSIDLFEKLATLRWLTDLSGEQLSAFSRTLIALQLWQPSRNFVLQISELTTDVGYGESVKYGLVSQSNDKSGEHNSIWRQGWTALSNNRFRHTFKLARNASNWGIPNGDITDFSSVLNCEVNSVEQTNRENKSRNNNDWEESQNHILKEYMKWLAGADGYSGDKLKLKSIVLLRASLTLTNLVRKMKSRPLFSNDSLPTRKLIRNRKLLNFLNEF